VQNELFHKFFIKEFSLGNPAPVKSATMILFTGIPGKMRINGTWINQKITPGELNQLDLTGYVQPGENLILLDFPFREGGAAFAAKIMVEYMNTDRVEIFTDPSWQTMEQYTLPAPWATIRNLTAPEVVAVPKINLKFENPEWTVNLPNGCLEGLNNLYLHITYIGDKARCRLGHRLIADNWYNGTPWHLALKRLGNQVESQALRFEFEPFSPHDKVYYEIAPQKDTIEKTAIEKFEVVPEYKIKLFCRFIVLP
jgi:hypothetical protein